MSKPRLIAFYLPQFYPTPENDEWWQKGFTEWTNVGNAKPLFKGHYQPRVPADLGYYDLRLPEIREQQAEMAREAGIEGFCYWHYWFAGRRLLDRVFTEVVNSGKPDYPFCLCWANHSWYQKTWDSTKPDRLLIEQTYSGKQDCIDHFNALLPAFKDKRYMTVNGKLLFGLFSATDISEKDFQILSSVWNDLAKKNGLEGFEFFGFSFEGDRYEEIISKGFNNNVVDYSPGLMHEAGSINNVIKRIRRVLFRYPNKLFDYKQYVDYALNHFDPGRKEYPCILPNFDHSPRSAEKGIILHHSDPKRWGEYCSRVFELYGGRPHEENLVFVKSWNEWGEGNYLEPDMRYGSGFLDSLRKAYENSR